MMLAASASYCWQLYHQDIYMLQMRGNQGRHAVGHAFGLMALDLRSGISCGLTASVKTISLGYLSVLDL